MEGCFRISLLLEVMPASAMRYATSGPATDHSVKTHPSLRLRVPPVSSAPHLAAHGSGQIQLRRTYYVSYNGEKAISKLLVEIWVFDL